MHVDIYTKDGCPDCLMAKRLLGVQQVQFTEQKLGEHFTREILLERFPGAQKFPVIVVDGMNIGSYTQLKTLLEEQGSQQKNLLLEG